jgi:putative MATE family efflux protein
MYPKKWLRLKRNHFFCTFAAQRFSAMKDFTQGRILPQLIQLSLPIMGTGLAQLAYNFTDIFWLGRLSSEAVAAVSIAGFIMWITYAIALMAKIGVEVGIAQAIGERKLSVARNLAAHGLTISLVLAVVVGVLLLIFSEKIIGLFHLQEAINEQCRAYLRIMICCLPFWFFNPTFSGIYNGCGNSRTPFIVSTIGLVVNIVLDPLLIFGIGFFPALGVEGAALATAIALVVEGVVFIILLWKKSTTPLAGFRFFTPLKRNLSWRLIKVGAPPSLQNMSMAIISMSLSAIAASVGGHVGVAVLGAGSQIESLSWITAMGVATALGAYVGQNYGAQKMQRVMKSYIASMGLVLGYGAVVSACFILFGRSIFSLIIPDDAAAISEGARYLFIFGISQALICAEIAAGGAFNGISRSHYSAAVSIVLTVARIPVALWLSRSMGLAGVWWAMSLSAMLKGIILSTTFPLFVKRIAGKMTSDQ